MFDFRQQLRQGELAERFLDRFFSKDFVIRRANRHEQRSGIDRWFTRRDTAQCFSVEYKTDWRADSTHNAFIETVSVDTTEKKGWCYTTQAQYVLYYIPGDGLIYVLCPAQLRKAIENWRLHYPERRVKNRNYHTCGVIVPLVELERIARQVLTV